jgi:hypothetical protein
MEEDLIIGDGKPDEGEIEFVTITDTEYILAAAQALDAAESANPLTNEDSRRIKRIQRKALAIIDHCISEMYKEIFDDPSEE